MFRFLRALRSPRRCEPRRRGRRRARRVRPLRCSSPPPLLPHHNRSLRQVRHIYTESYPTQFLTVSAQARRRSSGSSKCAFASSAASRPSPFLLRLARYFQFAQTESQQNPDRIPTESRHHQSLTLLLLLPLSPRCDSECSISSLSSIAPLPRSAATPRPWTAPRPR